MISRACGNPEIKDAKIVHLKSMDSCALYTFVACQLSGKAEV